MLWLPFLYIIEDIAGDAFSYWFLVVTFWSCKLLNQKLTKSQLNSHDSDTINGNDRCALFKAFFNRQKVSIQQVSFEVLNVQLDLCVVLWMVLMSLRQWMSREGYWQLLVASYQSDPWLKSTAMNSAGRTKYVSLVTASLFF